MSPQQTTDVSREVAAIQSQLGSFDSANASLCSYWPMAKTVMSVLAGLAGSYPTVVTAINALVAAGNSVCPSAQATETVLACMKQEGINSLDDMAAYLVRETTGRGAANDCIVYQAIVYDNASVEDLGDPSQPFVAGAS